MIEWFNQRFFGKKPEQQSVNETDPEVKEVNISYFEVTPEYSDLERDVPPGQYLFVTPMTKEEASEPNTLQELVPVVKERVVELISKGEMPIPDSSVRIPLDVHHTKFAVPDLQFGVSKFGYTEEYRMLILRLNMNPTQDPA